MRDSQFIIKSDEATLPQPIKFRPSNGTEGECFFEGWCSICARDKSMNEGIEVYECEDEDLCQIIGATMRFDIDDPDYPKEWIMKDGQPTCTAFIPVGQPIPTRDDLTIDMFEVQP